MEFNGLPKDIQKQVLKLASEYPITIQDATKCYIMGADHAYKLCQLKSIKAPDNIIRLINSNLWEKKNKEIWNQLKCGFYRKEG